MGVACLQYTKSYSQSHTKPLAFVYDKKYSHFISKGDTPMAKYAVDFNEAPETRDARQSYLEAAF